MKKLILSSLTVAVALGCAQTPKTPPKDYYGTLEPFAKESIYFVMTDRFVDGDESNNYPNQGGQYPTFDQKLLGPEGRVANIGYLGGDFKGILNNADYIADMGFTSVWITPIVDNPDEHFSGGEPIEFGGHFKDGGKTGYHGYWGVNFYQLDEHLPSADLDFRQYNQAMKQRGLKTVMDIVGNHGSPAFEMPKDQPKFGELYDIKGKLVADHQNLAPEDLDPNNPLHQFFHRERDFLQLTNNNENNPAFRDYMIESYLHWIEQGVDAIRIDTIRHMPFSYWKEVSDRIRAKYPGMYLFGESFEYDAERIAKYTLPENGSISVLDFPSQKAMAQTFENPNSDFAALEQALYLHQGPYANPYDLTIFYDNHDMARMNASDNGFIDANNWLFTSRGIPAIYYGSEIGFQRGLKEHMGNRNYFGQQNVELAKNHKIQKSLSRIAKVRKEHIALQQGLMLNLKLSGQTAAFYRVFQHQGVYQTALVMLNKGDSSETLTLNKMLQPGSWTSALSGKRHQLGDTHQQELAPHSVEVLIFNQPLTQSELLLALDKQQGVYQQ